MNDIPFYVINLDRSKDRLSDITTRFERKDQTFIRIPAVWGLDVFSDYDAEAFKEDTIVNRPITPGEIGCTLSHIKALETGIENGDEFFVILEDDLFCKEDYFKFINEFIHIIRNGNRPFKTLNMHTYLYNFDKKNLDAIPGKFQILEEKDSMAWEAKSAHLGMQSRVWHREGAKSFLEFIKSGPINRGPVDNMAIRWSKDNRGCYCTSWCCQDSGHPRNTSMINKADSLFAGKVLRNAGQENVISLLKNAGDKLGLI